MTEPVSTARRRWQVPLWVLLIVPAACAPVFYYLATRDRISPDERVERQRLWVTNTIKREFSPRDGEHVGAGDMLVILGWAHYKGGYQYDAESRWLMPDRTIHYERNVGLDAWNGDGLVPEDNLARLPSLLRALPPSDPAVPPSNRVVVAYPVDERWVVRNYRKDAIPKAFEDLVKALEFPDGNSMSHP
jgi:hypothetical protein